MLSLIMTHGDCTIPFRTPIKSYSQQITVVIHTFSTLDAFLSIFKWSEGNSIDASGFRQV